MLLIKNIGRPAASNANGISDPNGNPDNFFDIVDNIPTLTSDSSVLLLSAWLGSGTTGPAGPVDACCRGALPVVADIKPQSLSRT
jgi:hypothetical protein